MNVHKSTAIKGLNGTILKDALTLSIHHITHLFNKILKTNIILLDWKKSIVIPLHKGDSESDLNNYRSISLLPTPVKNFEKILSNSINDFLEKNNIFTVAQGGFMRKRSTTLTIYDILEDIYININKRNSSNLIFYDLKKAFDTVDHKLLLNKLDNLHLSDIKPLLSNYLSPKKQSTLVNNVMSSEKIINCGVPQGSILGPLLFLMFINDLPNVVKGSNLKLYADDAILYCAGKSVNDTIKMQTNDHDNIVNLCTTNNLTLNEKKKT